VYLVLEVMGVKKGELRGFAYQLLGNEENHRLPAMLPAITIGFCFPFTLCSFFGDSLATIILASGKLINIPASIFVFGIG
jgi:hypothetical protein